MEEVCGDSSTALQTLSSEQEQQPGGPPVYCQVLGCGVLLTGGKTYCIKKRTCTAHIQAESVMLSEDDTTAHRFCQQCGKFEGLNKFDGTKRSCRARLAKRRSGTRALLQKKGCKDNSQSDQNTAAAKGAAAAASASMDASGLTAEQQLMFMYGQHSNEQLLGLLSDSAADYGAADAGALSNSPQRNMPAQSMSDGAPMAAAAAANAAAAACNAAAAAAHQALSAPLYMLGSGGFSEARMQHAAGAEAVGGFGDEPMGQSDVLKALQALEDCSDQLQRLDGSATSAAGPGISRPANMAFPAEHTSCSLPLAQLDLGNAGTMPAPGSPGSSMGGAPCKSAPLGGNGLLQSLGLAPQRTRSTATAGAIQQQGSMGRNGSRLKWLIQELQQELDVCNPAEPESLNNDELGTLLCAALAPSTANAASAAAGAGQAVQMQGAPVQAGSAAAASVMGLMNPAQSGLPAGFSGDAQGYSPVPAHAAGLDLEMSKVQVQQLQQKIHHLQQQLQMKQEGGGAVPQSGAPPPAAAHTLSAAAGADLPPAYRSISGMSDVKLPAAMYSQRAALGGLMFGGGAAMTAPLPNLQAQLSATPSSLAAAAAAVSRMSRPSTPGGAVPSAICMDVDTMNAHGWMTHGLGVSQAMAMSRFQQQQQQQQRLQQVQQQAMSLQMSASAAMQQPDTTAAMQFMALQSQLKMVEDEMMLIMAQQAATAR